MPSRRGGAAIAGTLETGETLDKALASTSAEESLDEIVEALKPIWARAVDPEGEKGDATDGLTLEVALMDRRPGRENRFRILHG